MRDEKSFQTRNETAGILGPKRPDIDPVDQYQRRPGGSPGPKAISRLSDAVRSDLSPADNSRFSWASNSILKLIPFDYIVSSITVGFRYVKQNQFI